MISRDIVHELGKLGFKKNPKSRLDYQIFECGDWSVWFELEDGGMWVWIDKGGKIVRHYVKTNKESRELIKRLGTVMKKTA